MCTHKGPPNRRPAITKANNSAMKEPPRHLRNLRNVPAQSHSKTTVLIQIATYSFLVIGRNRGDSWHSVLNCKGRDGERKGGGEEE